MTVFGLNVEQAKKKVVVPAEDRLMRELCALLPDDACAFCARDGAPHIVICYRGRALGLELKGRSESYSEAQVRAFPKLRDAGMRIEVARDLDQALGLVREMGVPLKEQARHALRDVFRAETRRRP
jgi:hypothetical protein